MAQEVTETTVPCGKVCLNHGFRGLKWLGGGGGASHITTDQIQRNHWKEPGQDVVLRGILRDLLPSATPHLPQFCPLLIVYSNLGSIRGSNLSLG